VTKQQDRQVRKRVHQTQQPRVGALRGVDHGGASRRRGSGELAQVSALNVAEAQRACQRVEDLVRDVGLAALLDAAVVVGAHTSEHSQLVATQPRHAPRARKRLDAGLRGRQQIAACSQKRSQGDTIS
jgi:hypothetical protein